MSAIDVAMRGWDFAGRAAAYLKRRSREAGPLWRGMRIVQRYTAHYRRARRIYGSPATPPTTTLYDIGVQVVEPRGQGFLRVPSDFQAKVAEVARAVSAVLDRTEQCRFFPDVPPETLTPRTADVPAVVDGQVIKIEVRNPFAIDGIAALAEPLLAALEQQVYGCHLIVDKLYVYRSPVCRQVPIASWLWHFDNHPREILKVMVYLTDVDSESAPFEYLRDGQSRPRPGTPLAPLHSDGRVPAAQVERWFAEGWESHKLTGPAGTVLVFDQNVIHRGTLAKSRHRDVVVYQVRPAHFKASPVVDPRWTGTFGDLDFNKNPNEMRPVRRPIRPAS